MCFRKKALSLAAAAAALVVLTGCGQDQLADMLSEVLPPVEKNQTVSETSKWINSSIDGSIDADTPTDIKDDFYTAVNRDFLLEPLEKDENERSFSTEIKELFDERILALNKVETSDTFGLDEEVMSREKLIHIQDLVHRFAAAAADTDTRSDYADALKKYLDPIESIDSMEALNRYICNADGNNLAFVQLAPFYLNAPIDDSEEEANCGTYTVLFYGSPALTLGRMERYEAVGGNSTGAGGLTHELVQHVLGGMGYSDERINTILKGCLRFEEKLSRYNARSASLAKSNYLIKHNNSYTAESLKELAGNYPIMDVLKSYGCADSESFTVTEPLQIKNLGRIYTESNLEDIKCYYIVHTIMETADLLDDESATLIRRYDNYIENGNIFYDPNAEDDDDESESGSTRAGDGSSEQTGDSVSVDGAENIGNGDAVTDENSDLSFAEAAATATSGNASPESDVSTDSENSDDNKLTPEDKALNKLYENYIDKYLSDAYQQMYVAHYCTAEQKRQLTEITKELIEEFHGIIDEADWMSDETRLKAKEKLDAMGLHILYPDTFTDYEDLQFEDGDTLLDMLSKLNVFQMSEFGRRVNQPVDRSYWSLELIPTTMINAANLLSDNSINICAGIVAGTTVFDADAPLEYNLAKIGAVIGHEISHAFDTSGYEYDKNGRYLSWWTTEDQEAFKLRSDKLVRYYSGLKPVGDSYMDGNAVSGEVIADMGGMKAALRIASKLPDFDYDAFFKYNAELWADKLTYAYALVYMTNEHPPEMLRVNVTLAQFDEFQRTYGLAEGDGMYVAAEDRIAVW